jgi:hypothetical protein
MRPLRIQKDKSRHCLWPISFKWGNQLPMSKFFNWHGWQVYCEDVPVEKTSVGCIPGKRAVFGQTFHIGPLKILLGLTANKDSRDCSVQAPT